MNSKKRIPGNADDINKIYHTIIQTAMDGFWLTDLEGKILEVNNAYCKMSGYTEEELLTMTIADIEAAENMDEVAAHIAKVIKEGFDSFETNHRCKDGNIINVEVNVTYIRNKEGSGRFVVFVRDITQRKQAEIDLQEREKRFRDLALSSADWWWETDQKGRYIFCSERVRDYLGYEPEEIVGKTPFDFMSAAEQDKMRPIFARLAAEKKPMTDLENRNITKTGKEIILLTNGVPILDNNNNLIGYRGVDKDITERKQAEEEIKMLSERLHLATNGAKIGVWDLDLTRDKLIWNEIMFELYGVSRDDFSGSLEDWAKRIHPDDKPEADQVFKRALENKSTFDTEFRVLLPDGATRILKAYADVIYDEGNKAPTRMIGVNWDITERRKMDEKLNNYTREIELKNIELENARDLALEASRAKSTFLSTMSHEIRTPMNSIIGMAELLAETQLTQEQEGYVKLFKGAGETLLNLINDILDISKIEAGHLQLESQQFDLEDLIEKTATLMSFRAHEKGLELASRILPETPIYLEGDAGRLQQVLVNLLGNAVKFTEKGEVVLTVKLNDNPDGQDEAGEGQVNISFSVRDTGIGIAREKLEQIFESFTQADTSTTRKYGGTGLGLHISKQLVEMMGGEIKVKSAPGRGSTFYFTIQLKKAKPEPGLIQKKYIPELKLDGFKILAIDDNDTNRLILKETLEQKKAVVEEAEDGFKGLSMLREADAAGKPYRLLLLDCMMPGIDGFTIAKTLSNEMPDLPIIMLSSDFMCHERVNDKDVKLDAFLLKPVKRQDLFNAIAMALDDKKEKPQSSLHHSSSLAQRKVKSLKPLADAGKKGLHENEKNKKILLVEDNVDNQLLIKAYLKKQPLQVHLAENGKKALDQIIADKFDLVLMDIQMPVMDGYQATREIRAWEKKQGENPVPIIALTAYALKEEVEKALDAGCSEHLTKPVKKATLLEAIKRHMQP